VRELFSDLSDELSLTPARVARFQKLGLYNEANYCLNAILDECVDLIGKEKIDLADSVLSELIKLGLSVKHLNYMKALCLISHQKIKESQEFLLNELRIDPYNKDVELLLKQVKEEISKS
jgi:hypothetical protein